MIEIEAEQSCCAPFKQIKFDKFIAMLDLDLEFPWMVLYGIINIDESFEAQMLEKALFILNDETECT